MSQRSPRLGNGFTLVELLVAILVVSVLVAMLLPAIQQARESGRRTQCSNNLKQLGLGLLSVHQVNGKFPPALGYKRNWIMALMPHVELQTLYDSYDFKRPFGATDANNQPMYGTFTATEVPVLKCPSDNFANTLYRKNQNPNFFDPTPIYQFFGRANYGANGCLGMCYNNGDSQGCDGPKSARWKSDYTRGVMGSGVSVSIKQILDGTTKTILLAEIRAGVHPVDYRGVWASTSPAGNSLWAHGSDNVNAPNSCFDGADQLASSSCSAIVTAVTQKRLRMECMTCGPDSGDYQHGARSQHLGGIFVCMADGSVRWISDFIQTNNHEFSPTVDTDVDAFMAVWQRLNASSDGLMLDDSLLDF